MEAVVLTLSDYEIERGKPSPSKNHSIIQSNIIFLTGSYRKKYKFMIEIALELDYWNSTPDIAIFPPMVMDTRHDEVRITEPPLGVIEILSPTQSMTELTDKAEKYFEYGVKSVWLVIPNLNAVAVYSTIEDYKLFRKGVDTVLQDQILEIEVNVNEMFE